MSLNDKKVKVVDTRELEAANGELEPAVGVLWHVKLTGSVHACAHAQCTCSSTSCRLSRRPRRSEARPPAQVQQQAAQTRAHARVQPSGGGAARSERIVSGACHACASDRQRSRARNSIAINAAARARVKRRRVPSHGTRDAFQVTILAWLTTMHTILQLLDSTTTAHDSRVGTATHKRDTSPVARTAPRRC